MTKIEYAKLVTCINHHMELYYNQDEPEISDYEYDQLMLQLKSAETEHPIGLQKIPHHRKLAVLPNGNLV